MARDVEPGSVLVQGVDVSAREDIVSLESTVRDLATVVWGLDKQNGLRSKVKSLYRRKTRLQESIDLLRKDWETWRDIERPKTCLGVDELKKHLKEHEAMSANQLAIELAKINSKNEKWKVGGAVLSAFLALAGVAYTAWSQSQTQLILKALVQADSSTHRTYQPADTDAGK